MSREDSGLLKKTTSSLRTLLSMEPAIGASYLRTLVLTLCSFFLLLVFFFFVERNCGVVNVMVKLLIGLQRCGKSCRLRWTNYLRPDLKHGQFTVDEEHAIVKLHSVVGNR